MRLSFLRLSKWSLQSVRASLRRSTDADVVYYGNPNPLKPFPLYSFSVRNELIANPIFRRWKSKKKPSEDDVTAPDGTFTAEEMELNMIADEKLQKKPEDWSKCMWKVFTDYMFSVRWDDKNGWGTPSINPVARFKIHPGSKCLHYGVEVFEGMKAYRGNDGFIRLFRPDLYMKRLLDGAKRLHLPTFCGDQLTECIKRLVKMEQDWIPEGEGHSLYIRPCFIGTEACFTYTPSKSALLYVVLCPVTDAPLKPISVYADKEHVKSWPGGFGDVKMGGNYGPMIHLQNLAEKHDCQQVMWLQMPDENITDLGFENVFFVIKNDSGERELVTPPANGLILNGVMRQSILELCNESQKFKVVEKDITMPELLTMLNQKKLKEIFGTGSTHIISPVVSIVYEGSKYDIPTMKQEQPIHRRLKTALKEIHFGRVDHKWAIRVDEKN